MALPVILVISLPHLQGCVEMLSSRDCCQSMGGHLLALVTIEESNTVREKCHAPRGN